MATIKMQRACALASPNIALVKYWGKRASKFNLPAADSLSISLHDLYTRTLVEFVPELEQDELYLGKGAKPVHDIKVSRCLDMLRQRAALDSKARVITYNNFPTAAGLASSASGFAALVVAANRALNLEVDKRFLSTVARVGSGSAARSLYSGFVHMHKGQKDNGEDAYAEVYKPADYWPLEVVVAITSESSKKVSSGKGMQQSRLTSPYHQAWIDSVGEDIELAKKAIDHRDFASLAEVSEHSCLKMHADMLATRPPLLYWNPVTVAVIERIRHLREVDGLEVFFTIDAGPQVKAVCTRACKSKVYQALQHVPGVKRVMSSKLGDGAKVVTCDAMVDA